MKDLIDPVPTSCFPVETQSPERSQIHYDACGKEPTIETERPHRSVNEKSQFLPRIVGSEKGGHKRNQIDGDHPHGLQRSPIQAKQVNQPAPSIIETQTTSYVTTGGRAHTDAHTGSLPVMGHDRFGGVMHGPTACVHSRTPVQIFKIQEVAFFHRPHVVDRFPAYHHCRPGNPIHHPRCFVVKIQHQVPPKIRCIWKQLPKKSSSKQNCTEGVISPAGILEGSVGIQKFGCGNSDFRMRFHKTNKSIHRPGVNFHIRVEDHKETPFGLPYPAIDPTPKPQIRPRLDHPDPIKRTGDFGAFIPGVVVDHKDLDGNLGFLGSQSFQTSAQQLRGLVGNDNH